MKSPLLKTLKNLKVSLIMKRKEEKKRLKQVKDFLPVKKKKSKKLKSNIDWVNKAYD